MTWASVSLCLVLSGCQDRQAKSAFQQQAGAVLREFLLDLHEGRYAQAVEMYGGDYVGLREWNAGVSTGDASTLFQNGCTINGLQCYPLGRIVAVLHADATEVTFLVELAVNADSTLTTGPCCGEAGPAESQFRFTVRRIGGRILVASLPPYVT
jgi:hypothetical protein